MLSILPLQTVNASKGLSYMCSGGEENVSSKELGTEAGAGSVWLPVFREFSPGPCSNSGNAQKTTKPTLGLPTHHQVPPASKEPMNKIITGKNSTHHVGNFYHAVQASLRFFWYEKRRSEESVFEISNCSGRGGPRGSKEYLQWTKSPQPNGCSGAWKCTERGCEQIAVIYLVSFYYN